MPYTNMDDFKHSTNADRELVRSLNGLYIGQLDDSELASFNRCVKDGYATTDYHGAGILLGIGKVWSQ